MNRFVEMVRRTAGALLNLECDGCGTRVGAADNSLCPACRAALVPVPEPRCPECGGVNGGILRCCPECLEAGGRPWRGARSLFLYEGMARKLILGFKFSRRTELAALFAELAEPEVKAFGCEFDLIVPVPLHWTRRLRRGYNQCELLARELSARTGIEWTNALARKRNGGHQSRRGRAERLAAMREAFSARRRPTEGKRILLVDDVFTTGATLTAAAEALNAVGAASVCVLTIARRN